jgi:DNA polymerase-3 subunit alpha
MSEQDLYLRFRAEKGLKARGKDSSPEYLHRLQLELNDIAAMNFASYFLVVADYVGWAKNNQIPVGPGRGSGVGSLVAYSLRITDADPIKYGLLWERFLNRGRVSMPDFDIDFCMRRRSEVIQYVVDKYGSEQVAQIGTTGTMKARLAIRDTARALGLDPETIDKYGKLVPDEARGGQGEHAVTLAKCLTPDPAFVLDHKEQLDKFRTAYDRDKSFHEVVNRAVEIEGVPKSIGTHAAGVVIWDRPLTTVVPLARTKEGLPATQWSDKEVESVGLVN